MKKILLLGGSAQQVIAIETARKLGYYTVLCDFLPDNPGQYSADKFYLVSTTDKEAVFKVALDEKIDGVLAYASDPAAPTAAYITEKLGLPGNPYESVEILCNKDKFRKFLSENGFNTPFSNGYSNLQEAENDLKSGTFKFPVIVKPVDSSGSKGATVLYSSEDVKKAIEFALSFSRSKKIIVEEFIEKKHPYLIGGDIFIIEGEIVLWGLLNCHRDKNVNELVPVGKSYHPDIEENDLDSIKQTLSDLVKKLDIKNGSMNVELIVDKNNSVWPIDIGPRSGGNMIPDLLSDMFGVNISEMSVLAAMNEKIKCKPATPNCCFATHNLHSNVNGVYDSISFSAELEKYIYRKYIYCKSGDKVEYFDNASKCLGIIFMKFENKTDMKQVLDTITDMYTINLK